MLADYLELVGRRINLNTLFCRFHLAFLAILLGISGGITAEENAEEVKEEQSVIVNREDRGPDVVLRETEERTIYEYRQQGRLTMIKVVPKVGPPYFLVPVDRSENFGDISQSTRLIPQWVIREF